MTEVMELLKKSVADVLPSFEVGQITPISACTERSPAVYLGGFYLFPVHRIAIAKDVEDVSQFISERYLNVLTASHRAGLTVMTAVSGSRGSVQIYLGFKSDVEKDPRVFERLLQGVLPGSDARLSSDITVDSYPWHRPKAYAMGRRRFRS